MGRYELLIPEADSTGDFAPVVTSFTCASSGFITVIHAKKGKTEQAIVSGISATSRLDCTFLQLHFGSIFDQNKIINLILNSMFG